MNRENSSNIIRILAGGYLLILSYNMIKSLLAGEVDKEWIIITAVVFFIIAGGVILYFGIRGMIKQSKLSQDEVADENLNEELEAEEEIYGEYIESGLTEGKMKSIGQELSKLKDKEAKDIVGREVDAKTIIENAEKTVEENQE